MTDLAEIANLKRAVFAVKEHLESLVDQPPNDLIITGVEDRGDLWVFHWNNAWPLLGNLRFAIPCCPPVVVLKGEEQVRLLPPTDDYTESLDDRLVKARTQWTSRVGVTAPRRSCPATCWPIDAEEAAS